MEVEAGEMKEMQFSAQMTNYVYNGEGHAASMFTYDYNAGSRQPTSSGDRTQGCAYEATTFSGGELAAADSQRFSDFTHVYQQFSAGIGSDTPPVYYYGQRYYQPEVGRWACRDPIVEEGSRLLVANVSKSNAISRKEFRRNLKHALSYRQSANDLRLKMIVDSMVTEIIRQNMAYLFCENQPLSRYDLFGLEDKECCPAKDNANEQLKNLIDELNNLTPSPAIKALIALLNDVLSGKNTCKEMAQAGEDCAAFAGDLVVEKCMKCCQDLAASMPDGGAIFCTLKCEGQFPN